jgi:hypothetical protein
MAVTNSMQKQRRRELLCLIGAVAAAVWFFLIPGWWAYISVPAFIGVIIYTVYIEKNPLISDTAGCYNCNQHRYFCMTCQMTYAYSGRCYESHLVMPCPNCRYDEYVNFYDKAAKIFMPHTANGQPAIESDKFSTLDL